jgi:multidrug efflux pump subunit AcrA (membrane-fusion protein)
MTVVGNFLSRRTLWGIKTCLGLLVITLVSACSKEPPKPPALRLVKSFTVGASVDTPGSAQGQSMLPASLIRDPAQLTFDAAGRVMSVFVAQGDTVTAGQAIARIDPLDMALSETSARTQLAAAQAELDFNEADFRRFQELHQKGFISGAEIDRRRAQLTLARARFEATSDQLGYITLRAIEPGRIASVLVKPGQTVSPRQVAAIVSLTERPGAQRSITSMSRSLRIPLSALVNGDSVYRLKAIADGQATLERVPVSLGNATESSVELVTGLSIGDRIVAAGTHVLSEGERVRLAAP